jgi:hypothetical protein
VVKLRRYVRIIKPVKNDLPKNDENQKIDVILGHYYNFPKILVEKSEIESHLYSKISLIKLIVYFT